MMPDERYVHPVFFRKEDNFCRKSYIRFATKQIVSKLAKNT